MLFLSSSAVWPSPTVEITLLIGGILFFTLFDECDLLKRQVAGGGACSGEMVQNLANASKDVCASIDDLIRHAAHAQKVHEIPFTISPSH